MITLSEVSQYLISIQVANKSALPPAATNANKLYYCIASEGTPYVGFIWGGNYYPSGWYRSNGVTWEYQTTAFQASLFDVVAGVIQDQFVSPYTLKQGPNLDQSGAKNYAVASGTDTYTATIAPAISAYATGQMFHINFTNTNTGASTINLNGLGGKNIVDASGAAVTAGILKGVVSIIYNGASFQILGASVVSQTITNGVTDKAPSEDAVFDALALKSNTTDTHLLFQGAFYATNLVDSATYYFSNINGLSAAGTQSFSKFGFNQNRKITNVVLTCSQNVNYSNEAVSLYIRKNATTDSTITTSLDLSTVGLNTSKVFYYTVNIDVTTGDDYEFKIVTPAFTTNGTNSRWHIELYGY